MTATSTPTGDLSADGTSLRLTQYAAGGGCACKVPPGELERVVRGLPVSTSSGDLLVGLEHGDDAAAVRLDGDRAVVLTADFFTPVVDDAATFGRIAAANALSDVYAMGGTPLLAVNLLAWPRDLVPFEVAAEVLHGGAEVCAEAGAFLAGGHSIDDREPKYGLAVNLLAWPRDTIPFELAAEVLLGGAEVCAEAGAFLAGGHSIDDPEPKYGLAVTGTAHPDRLLRNDAGRPGTPLTLTKPLGLGVLNNRHKATGAWSEQAVAVMTTLNRDASAAAVAAGLRCATDVTGFGLLGHLYKLARASGVGAVVDSAAVPYVEGAREALASGFVPGGSRRNLDWVRPHLEGEHVGEEELLLLADAQTSGGLLVAGELPGHPVVGELVRLEGPGPVLRVR